MKKKNQSKSTLVFFLCLVLHLSPQAQIHKYFIITGKIISDTEIIESGTIQIVKKDQPALTVEIPKNGHFRLELDYNSYFKLIFSQKGYLSKVVKINTEIPVEIMNQTANLSHFLMAVRLYKDMEDAANLLPDDQIQKIKYSTQLNNFARMSTIFDQEYVDDVKITQNQAVNSQEIKSKQIYEIF